jgi:hypothetical protein
MPGTLLHEGVTQVKTTQRREYSKIMATPSLEIEQFQVVSVNQHSTHILLSMQTKGR